MIFQGGSRVACVIQQHHNSQKRDEWTARLLAAFSRRDYGRSP
jgi:hypothetical protein